MPWGPQLPTAQPTRWSYRALYIKLYINYLHKRYIQHSTAACLNNTFNIHQPSHIPLALSFYTMPWYGSQTTERSETFSHGRYGHNTKQHYMASTTPPLRSTSWARSPTTSPQHIHDCCCCPRYITIVVANLPHVKYLQPADEQAECDGIRCNAAAVACSQQVPHHSSQPATCQPLLPDCEQPTLCTRPSIVLGCI